VIVLLNVIDVLFLVFIFVTLYIMILFFLIFQENKKKFYKHPKPWYRPLTVITPAHNEEHNIRDTINAVKNMRYPKKLFEYIVVDDGSTDNTAKIARECGVKVITRKKGGKASAINLGVSMAKGEIIACVDADSYPEKDTLIKTVPCFRDPNVAAVTTLVMVKNPKNILQRLQRLEYMLIGWARKMLEHIDSVYVTPGPLSLYRKSTLMKVGGFDEKTLTEDIEITFRLQKYGYKIRMIPARVYTNAPDGIKKWWHQRIRWDIGGIEAANKYKGLLFKADFGSMGIFIMPFFLASMVLSILGFAVFAYIIGVTVFGFFVFLISNLTAGVNPLAHIELLWLPDVFMVFGILVLAMSIIYLKINLKKLNEGFGGVKSCLETLLYLTIYISLFPILLIQSFWKIITKKKTGW